MRGIGEIAAADQDEYETDSCDDDEADGVTLKGSAGCSGSGCCCHEKAHHGGSGGGKAGGRTKITGSKERVPALLALLHVVRGVPPEALSQELDTVVSVVVQALGSSFPPLQRSALDTLQVFREPEAHILKPLATVVNGAFRKFCRKRKMHHHRRAWKRVLTAV